MYCMDDSPVNTQADGPSMVPETTPHDMDSEYSLADLWNKIIGSQTLQLDNEFPDLFAELQAYIASGQIAISTPIVPTNKERELIDDSAPDFGIEIPEIFADDPLLEPASTNYTVSPDQPLYPWPSKAHFTTSLLLSSLRLLFSEAQKKAVLNWAKELGKCQSSMQDLIGDPTEKVTSHSGNVFYINSVVKAIAKDYANPLTRLTMQDYQEDGRKGMSEVFNGKKMLFDLLSPPAVQVDRTVYFMDKLLQESSGGYFIPKRFFLAAADAPTDTTEPCEQSEKVLYALGRAIEWTEAGFIVSDGEEIIPTSMFLRSFGDIAATCGELDCGLTPSSVKYASLSPNLLRENSKGQMVHTVPLIIFMDDLMRAMKESISDAAQSGVIVWDCKYNEEVMLVPYVLFLTGDNPMQAEECSHAGLSCNHFCRTCDIGGTKEYKESEAGYNGIFTSGNLRTPEKTSQEIQQQFQMAFKLDATTKIQHSKLVELGMKLRKCTVGCQSLPKNEVEATLRKEFKELLKGEWLDDTINPLLRMNGLDIHMDTPTEILHTILLGVMAFLLEKAKFFQIFQYRLESIDKDGLNAPCLNVLSYLDEHPEQARLLGIPNSSHSPPIPGSGKIETATAIATGKSVRNNVAPWETTCCAKILGTVQPGSMYFAGKSVVTSEGEYACLNSYVIFRQPMDKKATLEHKPTPSFFLNVYSIHNYDHIQRVVPIALCETLLRVTNVAERVAKKGGDKPQLAGSGDGVDAQPSLAPPSAFDHTPTKPQKPTPKAKAKASTGGMSEAAPSQHLGALQQQQIAFAPPMGAPLQHFYSPAPQPYYPPHQSFPPPLPIPSLPLLHSSPLLHQSPS
ncbi:uncharacterized protein F5891DRAFT_1131025 [Suillus fuscotomentosus]|uniref:Uncharacterized protein n=1 Tax=Suillus fuscotomentosus TaxID=1912939 RepID=A0AAD4DUY3_9AGAM|nr:uncharacterized protein F5891DRAFT_1131025 [Suillus fuscotomentosus]KAG1894217.1 hypothetical protein F5891DRAFT_1131025 [Suillus fuscotomentosus]